MNRTNVTHGVIAFLMQATYALLGLPGGWFAGAAVALAAFISREHAHRQNDIADTTGVSVPKQNPLMGFLGWSEDSRLDVLFPMLACGLGLVFDYYSPFN